MLKAKEMLTRMTKHLSDWLIMRRNPEGSTGGKLLLGIAQETESLNEAIQTYVDTYFISNYFMQTHEIDSEFMEIHVGALDYKLIQVVSPAAIVCDCMDTFVNACNYSYYENGYLYFKKALVEENSVVQYTISDTLLTEIAKRVPVWNVFDEFALYVGIERIDRETNERLLERILYQSQHPVNSSEEGMRHAIANITGIQPKEILIEPIDESNCFENDFTKETLFDQLLLINRDVYRSKRWGVDYWHFDMEHTSYIPHTYDVKPAFYQDGVGDNHDLFISSTHEHEEIHMEVITYQKDEKKITSYHEKYPAYVDTILKLHKPEDMTEPVEVMAQIEAGTLTDVTDAAFCLTYKASRTACEQERLMDLVDTTDLVVNKPVDWIIGNRYTIKVKPVRDFTSFNAKVMLDDVSLIENKQGFKLDHLGYLTHDNIKLYANQLSYFSEHINFSHEINGFKLAPYSREGRLVLPLKNMGGNHLHYELYMPDFDPIQDEALSYQYFTKLDEQNAYASDLFSDAFFAIRTDANKIRFYIEGSAIVFIKTDKGDAEYSIENAYFETALTLNEPIDYLIHIIPTNVSQPVIIKEIAFNRFHVTSALLHGELTNGILPNIEDNELIITVQTAMSLAPSIGFIYVGESISELQYETDSFLYTGQSVDFVGKGDTVFEVYNLATETAKIYTDNMATLQLPASMQSCDFPIDTTHYKTVDHIETCSGGQVIIKDGKYFLRLEPGDICDAIIIKGTVIDFEKAYYLDTLVNKKSNASYYISPVAKGFIELLDNKITLVKPVLEHLYGEYSIENYAPYTPVFSTSTTTSCTHFAKAPIDNFYLLMPLAKTYKAINKLALYEASKKDVAVNKNFVPLLPYDERLFYQVTALTDGLSAYFYDKSTEQESLWSIDLKTLNYYADFNLIEQLKIDYEEIAFNIKLDKHVLLPEYMTDVKGNTLDLKEYIITTEEGVDVYYTSPQMEDIALDPTYLKTEKFILNESGIKKLAYCNIHEILYCGFEIYQEGATSTIEAYELFSQLGIICFDDAFKQANAGRTIYIHYTISKPTMLILSTDKLYDNIAISYEAYELTSTEYYNVPIRDFKNTSEAFLNADYATATVFEPGFLATCFIDKGLISITESMPKNRVVVKKGFYYIGEEEYYLFGTVLGDYQEFKNEHIEAIQGNYMENGIMLYQKTENFVKNSIFNTGERTKLFSTDFDELKSVNYFKRLNACEQINLWQSVNMQVTLDEGLYSNGVHFSPVETNHAHFIGMPIEQTGEDLTLSLWLKGDTPPIVHRLNRWEEEIHLTLGKKEQSLSFEKTGFIYHIDLPYDPNVFYYLTLSGDGVVDDLVLCDKAIYDINHHTKNINKIFMPQFPSETSDRQRLLFTHQKAYTGTMQMDTNGDIVPTSNMSYGYTKLLDSEWMKHVSLYKATYDNNCLIPQDESSYFITEPIYIPSKEHIKELAIRTNYLSEGTLPLILYTGNAPYDLKPVSHTDFDHVNGDKIKNYIQVRCALKEALYSLDISARYVEGAVPNNYFKSYFESELFDLGKLGIYEIEKLYFKVYNDAQVYVRAGKIANVLDSYKQIEIDADGQLIDRFQLGDSRYIQFRLHVNDYCNLEYFDIIKTGGDM